MWFGMGFMWLWPIGLIIIGIIIYFAVVSSSHRSSNSHRSYNNQQYYSGGRALEILKERYAQGEITKEQYLQMKEELIRN
ncbi:MAG: SHOCT domain-containing protein [Candidatus Bathyarchaeota archaeon]